MAELFTLNQEYSTTRLVTREVPIIEEPPDAAFETVLFLPEGEGRKGEGGLRIQGYFKRSLPEKPLITVITVVFNGAKYLKETILSVINQSYDNVEYIVIDGGSTDGTLDIIHKYEHIIDYWVSEKDEGIYHAMNKGIYLGTGEWVNFMNSGDWFYSNQVLLSIFSGQCYSNIGVIYGNHEVRYPSGLRRRIVKAGELKNLWKYSVFSHQATFVAISIQKTKKFNCFYKIAADFDFFYLSWKNNTLFCKINLIIASIDADGVSNSNRIDSIIERWLIVNKNYIVNLVYIHFLLKEIFKYTLKKITNIDKEK